MTFAKKLPVAFLCFVAATVLLAVLVPDESRLLGVPGTLLIVYAGGLVYRRSADKKAGK